MPLHRQLYSELRRVVLTGELSPGSRLPPTRMLARELGVSRNTIVNAFEQLIAEGYLQGRMGAGTWVTQELPESALSVSLPINDTAPSAEPSPSKLSNWGQRVNQPMSDDDSGPRAFTPGVPEIASFPFKVWEKLAREQWQAPPLATLGYSSGDGFAPLRAAIADYLRSARGVRCSAEQIILTSGTQQALDLIGRILLDPDDPIWVENPGYRSAHAAFGALGAQLTPVPIDADGLDVAFGRRQAPDARLVYVTPSHQYPTGICMSLARRLELLRWADHNGAWIVEDDYDSEFRYEGRPIACLQGLDQAARVLYVGTFSKILFPALRLGYIVVPRSLINVFRSAIDHTTRGVPMMTQRTLYHFIDGGHFTRHIRRMRTLYARRQAFFLELAREKLGDWLEFRPQAAGLHMVGWLPGGVDDRQVEQQLAAADIDAPALSGYSLTPLPRGGLVLGFGGCTEPEIAAAIYRMAKTFVNINTPS